MPKVRQERAGQGMTAKEKTARLKAAIDAMGDGLSQDELAEMTAAITGVRTIAEVAAAAQGHPGAGAPARRSRDLCL